MNVRFTVQYLLPKELEYNILVEAKIIPLQYLEHKLNSISVKDRESSKPMSHLF